MKINKNKIYVLKITNMGELIMYTIIQTTMTHSKVYLSEYHYGINLIFPGSCKTKQYGLFVPNSYPVNIKS